MKYPWESEHMSLDDQMVVSAVNNDEKLALWYGSPESWTVGPQEVSNGD
jgi:hypothetical protein